MHGWTMTAEHYIFKCNITTILDNMIEKKNYRTFNISFCHI